VTRYESVAVSPGAASVERAVQRAVEVLRAGGVLAHPTDTVYGLGGAALPEVDLEVATLKGRTLDSAPLIRIAADTETLQTAFPELVWPVEARRLALGFWPGALTLVLEDGSGRGTAVRVEGHPLIQAVLRAWAAPIGSTSLNLAGEPPAVTARQARECLERMPDVEASVVFLDAGALPGPPPSTLVSFLDSVPVVLREGAVPSAAIQDCLRGTGS
jgi:L-threonylcarbamoyladenylate synthase